MGFLDKIFRPDQPATPAEEPIQEMEPEQTTPTIRNNHDFMLALADKERLAEAEAWLMKEREHSSQGSHNESWVMDRLSLLYHRYDEIGDTASAKKVYDLLPENIQVDIDQHRV